MALVHTDQNIQIVKMARLMADVQKQDESRRKSMKHKSSQTATQKPDIPDKKVFRNQFTHMSKDDLQIIGQAQNQLMKNKLT